MRSKSRRLQVVETQTANTESYEDQQARLWAEMTPLEIPSYAQRDIQERVAPPAIPAVDYHRV